MPELPEVETVRRQLESKIVGKKILAVKVLYPKAVRPIKPAVFIRAVTGATIKKVWRRAKLILIELSNNRTLVTHLKMTGHLFLDRDVDSPRSSTEIIFDLSGPTRLVYDDIRRFGFVRLMETGKLLEYLEAQYGSEPLDPSFTVVKFKKLLEKKPRAKIKPLLMDQAFLAGVGNIYAQEACFCAGVSPVRMVETLSKTEIGKLHRCLLKILRESIKLRGTSADTYLDIFGEQGTFVKKLKVYGRDDKPCARCQTILKKITLGSRGTVFCPKCQK